MARKLTIIDIHKGISFNANLTEGSRLIGISENTMNKHLGSAKLFGIGQYLVTEPQELKERNFNDFNLSKIEP